MDPTVADVLAIASVQAGDPRVRAGEQALGEPVRWVHVSEIANVAGTLQGGELLLSTGIAAADPGVDLVAYVTALRDAGARGLIVELGPHLPALPEPMVRTARRLGFPLVELRRTVRFVEITEAVHAGIVNAQHERLRFTQQVNEVFTTLTVEGARAEEVLAQAGALSGHPVVLEDLAHHAIAFSGTRVGEVLRDWESRSRLAVAGGDTAVAGPERWLCTPVGPRRGRWGRLVVPLAVADLDRVTGVLERAAATLAITRMLHGGKDIALDAHGGMLRDLLTGQITDEHAVGARLRAIGLRVGRAYAVLVLAIGTPGAPSADADHAALDAAAATARTQGRAALTGVTAPGRVAIVFSCPAETDEPAAVRSFLAALSTQPRLPAGLVVAAATPATRFSGLSAALEEATHIADAVAADQGRVGAREVYRTRDLGARGLLWSLRADPRLHQFAELQLHPLLSRPAEQDLLELLRSYLAANGNVAVLARALHLSRPAVYARLKRLSDVLGRDIADAETRVSLHLAVIAHDQA
ncbi:PucR family transcriptional regulator [Actinokineospora globicatena]|uniref:PucR family transcriptional regulator n=1 Tax=Actinokineospora globicatena TaxID=103729 RepID=UPI0020A3BBE7|nr:PucR family transcriptional regulator [Actinokineospora globicatena]MCP2306737.1 purine catabolism regulatory protein [Actinokineospora globicatena]GLW82145.1 putative regulatory protein [Actinokineospora globicatena]GLW88938.1 putative regulatory protein [Actinokineospora globicatena]